MFYTALRDPRTGRLFSDTLMGFDNRQQRNAYLALERTAIPLTREEAQTTFGIAALDAIRRQATCAPMDHPADNTADDQPCPETEPEPVPFSFPGSKLFNKVRGGVHLGS